MSVLNATWIQIPGTMRPCDLRNVGRKRLPEGGDSVKVKYAVVHVDAHDKAAGNEAGLYPHDRSIALQEVA